MSSGTNVLYVALGQYRVRAAEEEVARFVAAGARVELVVGDLPEWSEATIPPGVTVHRVGGADMSDTLRAVRRLVLRRGGPADRADLLIAGDPPALPVAWAARKGRPKLTVHLEPSPDPRRRTAPADLAVVTPWYPSPNNALAGAFVRAAIGAVEDHFGRISILHTEDWTYPRRSRATETIGVAADRVVARCGNAVVVDRPEGELTRVAVPIGPPPDYATRAEAHLEMLRAALPKGRIEAPLIHAHTGIYGGVLATRLGAPDARIVVTEHSTFLPKVFAQTAARLLYEEVLERADIFLCVSQYLRDLVLAQFPQYADKVHIVPNVIDFDDFTMRPEPPREPLRWLYVGRLLKHKGVHTLVDGFARIAAEEPRATLTLVGSGNLETSLRARVTELGLADRIRLVAAVPPEDVGGVMHQHDLLVHPSHLETFGMTVVEAVATGMPVLVARSAGPQETLAGLDGIAGRLMDVSEDPDVIADGYRKLRARFDLLDVPAARASLLARYGRETVAARLLETYREAPARSRVVVPSARPAPAPEVLVPVGAGTASVPAAEPVAADTGPTPEPAVTPGSAGRIVVVAVGREGPSTIHNARDFVNRMVERGYAIDLVALQPEVWRRSRFGGDVRIIQQPPAEEHSVLMRTEQLLIRRLPGKVLAMMRAGTKRMHAIAPEVRVSRLQRLHTRVARAFERRISGRFYLIVRPRILWRIARREVVPTLDLGNSRGVVIASVEGVTIGWRLARRNPNLTVTTSWVAFDGETT